MDIRRAESHHSSRKKMTQLGLLGVVYQVSGIGVGDSVIKDGPHSIEPMCECLRGDFGPAFGQPALAMVWRNIANLYSLEKRREIFNARLTTNDGTDLWSMSGHTHPALGNFVKG